jgi:Spy/CpxP family protein refolding chaperone
MKKHIITGLVIISVATASLVAFGLDHRGKGFGHKPPMAKVLKQIDLTDDQKAVLKELRMTQKSQREAFREEMRANSDISLVFTEQGFDKAVFISKATERFQNRIALRADFMEKVYAILDEKQRAEFIHKMQEMRDKRGK